MTGTDNKTREAGTVFSGGCDGNIAIWQIPSETFYNIDNPYCESENDSIARKVAVWDKCHEGQPIWDI